MLSTKMIVQKIVFVLSGLLCKRVDILLVLAWIKAAVESFLSRSRAARCDVVDIHVFGFVGGTVGSLSFACFTHVLIECPLAVGDAVCSGCGFFGLLLLDLLVCLGLGDDVGQELEVLYTSDCVGCEIVSTWPESHARGKEIHTDVTILDVSARLALRLDNVVRLFDEMLQEHLSSDGDYEGGVVRAAVDVVVLRDDLLDTSD
jgi:hypothetical protein